MDLGDNNPPIFFYLVRYIVCYGQKHNIYFLVNNCLKDIFEPEHRFMGHITIARVKKIEDKQSFLKLINATTINKIIFTVREFYLKESILTNEGPIYKAIDKYCLKSK